MAYRVEELAAAAGVRVDTIRFYQAKGLLPAPRREGRNAIYSDEHLQRLRHIRGYQTQGLTLALIKRLLDAPLASKGDALLRAVAEEAGEPSLTRAELAAQSGLPEPLLASLEATGLLVPVGTEDGEPRYGPADLQMARAGTAIVEGGFPLDELLELSLTHAKNVNEVVDRAIEMFDRVARERQNAGGNEVAQAFRHLLPAVTTLAAVHFQRTLLTHALERLRQRGENAALEAAVAEAEAGRLEVAWR